MVSSKRRPNITPVAAVEITTGMKRMVRENLLKNVELTRALATSSPTTIWSTISIIAKSRVFFNAFQKRSS
ncbi:MAG: hypothetical protein ACLR30_12305 [[Clostridium] leptum]